MRRRVAATGKYTSLILGCLAALVPLGVLLLTSLKTSQDFATSGPLDLPTSVTFANFGRAFTEAGMATAFLNTTLILIVSVTGTIAIGTMAAYAIDRFEFRFKKVIVALFLLAALVPAVTTQVATFQVVNTLGLYNTRLAPIALFMGTDIVSIYIFLQFTRTIPIALDEAARLEGASSFAIYRRIILPLLKPAIATVVIIKGITTYNDFFIPFLYMPSDNLETMSTALFKFKGPFGAHWEDIPAGAILVTVPTFILFIVLQRFIYNGFTSVAVK